MQTHRLQAAVGRQAWTSLQRRSLIAAGTTTQHSPHRDPDRQRGALIGLSAGDTLAHMASRMAQHGPLTATQLAGLALTGQATEAGSATRQALISATAWSEDLDDAPRTVADGLISRAEGTWGNGRAIAEVARRRRNGISWFDAAPPSFGDAALPRAVAVGATYASDLGSAGTAASIDASVSHAHPHATHSASVLAMLVVHLVTSASHTDIDNLVRALIPSCEDRLVADSLRLAISLGPVTVQQACLTFGREPHAVTTLGLAAWACIHARDAVSMLTELAAERPRPTLLAVAGGLLGARFGYLALPRRWSDNVPLRAESLSVVGDRFAHSPQERQGAHVWFLLDRSGSMASISSDVESGIDAFITAQAQTATSETAVTLVQFDSNNVHDVLTDATPIESVPSMTGRFHPRGGTPLFDAIGRLLDRAERSGHQPTDQLVVVFTDGLENASHRWTRTALFDRITRLRANGWTFVFLGANQDSYAQGGGLGFSHGGTSNFFGDRAGVEAAFQGLGRATETWKAKDHARRHLDSNDFWGGLREGEIR